MHLMFFGEVPGYSSILPRPRVQSCQNVWTLNLFIDYATIE